jgi:hypothetical protein
MRKIVPGLVLPAADLLREATPVTFEPLQISTEGNAGFLGMSLNAAQEMNNVVLVRYRASRCRSYNYPLADRNSLQELRQVAT